jgi:hypothetical protein
VSDAAARAAFEAALTWTPAGESVFTDALPDRTLVAGGAFLELDAYDALLAVVEPAADTACWLVGALPPPQLGWRADAEPRAMDLRRDRHHYDFTSGSLLDHVVVAASGRWAVVVNESAAFLGGPPGLARSVVDRLGLDEASELDAYVLDLVGFGARPPWLAPLARHLLGDRAEPVLRAHGLA